MLVLLPKARLKTRKTMRFAGKKALEKARIARGKLPDRKQTRIKLRFQR